MSTLKGIQVGVIPLFLGVGCLPSPSPGTDVLISESGTSSSTGSAETSTTDSPTNTSVVTSTETSTDTDSSTSVSSSTSAAVCGDGIVDPGEECDDGDVDNTNMCTEECKKASCGDGFAQVSAEEECDDGDVIDSNGCTAECKTAICGDGIVWLDMEQCDDGNMTDEDDCTAKCLAAKCGDGIVQATVESCDDGNLVDGDGCTAECVEERWVFVSSATYKGDLDDPMPNDDVKGIALADARCNSLAAAAVPPLAGTFKAWLSDVGSSPAIRFDTNFTGLYRLVSAGRPIVATGWVALTTKELLHPIDADQTGTLISVATVWTNTLPAGSPASALSCKNWSSSNDTDTTTVGSSGKTTSAWTNLGAGQFCADSRRIYCFEDQ